MVHQPLRVFVTTAVFVLGQNGHECLRKRSFGKQASQQVGDFESNKKRVCVNTGAKCTCDNCFTNKAEDA